MKNMMKITTAVALLLVVSACAQSNPNSAVFSQYDYAASASFEPNSFLRMNNAH